MAGSIPRSFITDLLNRTDITTVIGDRIDIKRSGKHYKACCPFHNEKSPSFYIYDDAYHCFGCEAHGDAIGFLMDYERLEFVDAVETLAKTAGLEVPYENTTGQRQPRKPKDKDAPTAYSVLDNCAEKYYLELFKSENAQAVNYLKGRGLTGNITKQYRIGFAPDGWNFLSQPLIEKANPKDPVRQFLLANAMIKQHETKGHLYDFFNNRIMFPIRDHRGRVIAFGGRVLGDGKPKYLNSPETAIFKKSQTLYGLYEARMHDKKPDSLLVTEGYMDVVALAQFGIPHAVATLGTATSTEHIRLMFRYVPEIIFCFDGDSAGRSAAWKAVDACFSAWQDGKRIRFFFLPDGEDPDSLVRSVGKDGFLHQLKTDGKLLETFFFDHLSRDLDLNNISDRTALMHQAKPYLNKIPKGIYFEGMLSHLTELCQLPRDTVEKHLLTTEPTTYSAQQARQTINSAPSSPQFSQSTNTGVNSSNQGIDDRNPPMHDVDDYAQYEGNEMTGGSDDDARYYYEEALPENQQLKTLAQRVTGLLLEAPELAAELIKAIEGVDSRPETELMLTCFTMLSDGITLSELYIKLQQSKHQSIIQGLELKRSVLNALNHDEIKAEILDGLKQIQLQLLRHKIQIAEHTGDQEQRITLKMQEQRLLLSYERE